MKLLTAKWTTTWLLATLLTGGLWGLGSMGQAQVASPEAAQNPRQLDAEERSNVVSMGVKRGDDFTRVQARLRAL